MDHQETKNKLKELVKLVPDNSVISYSDDSRELKILIRFLEDNNCEYKFNIDNLDNVIETLRRVKNAIKLREEKTKRS